MVAFGLSTGLILLFIAGLTVVSLVLGFYLLTTNPPKDESKFLGIGAEKVSDEELEEQSQTDDQ